VNAICRGRVYPARSSLANPGERVSDPKEAEGQSHATKYDLSGTAVALWSLGNAQEVAAIPTDRKYTAESIPSGFLHTLATTEEETPMTSIPHSQATQGQSAADSDQPRKKDEGSTLNRWFRRFSVCAAASVGNKWAFIIALVVIIIWGITGPFFHFSDTWQLIINTGTTIVTFLMVFLIQNTQNRDAKAIHLKLDELIRAVKGARTRLVNLEDLSDTELESLHKEFTGVQQRAEHRVNHVHDSAQQAGKHADAASTAAERAESTAARVEENASRAEDLLERAERVATKNNG